MERYYYLLRLLESLMKNAKHCNLKKLLHKHLKQCPFPTCEKCKKVDYGSKVVNLAECCCSHHEVVLFVWDVIRHIVPIELLGDCSNWRTFMPNISKFIRLRRFESFSPSHTSQHHFLSKISRWLFENIIIPSIRSCFYVTEMQFRKQEVFYFPKPLWRKLANDAIGCLDEHSYKLLDRDSVPYIINKRNFGYATTRFLPKKTEMRILANTRAPCKSSRDGRSFFVKSVNSSLKELHTVLRKIKYEKPEKLGSSVFGYDDVYQKFYGFLRRVGSGELMKTDVFIVVGDVAKAFDSVDQDKLIGIIKCLSQEDNYHLRSYARVLSAKNGLRALQDHVGYDLTSNTNDIIKFEANTRLRSSSCVIIDQGESKHTKKEVLDHLLTENVKHNILNIDNKFYLQKVGIGQGSPISPLLCSFYLGDLERSIIFPFLREVCNKKNVPCSIPSHSIEQTEDDLSCLGSSFIIDSNGMHWSRTDDAIRCCNDKGMHENVLMRWIDDFLFISTCKKQATSFFRRMQRGFKEYNCDMNSEKFCISFDVKQNNHRQNSLYEGADGIQFIPWCGLLLNCRTLEIQADYTRYLGIPIWSTLTVDANDNCLFTLKDKLCNFTRPKCHPLFYDSYINSPQVVGLNAYQAFLLCAMKFHCFISSISDNTQLDPSSLLEAIEQSFRFMYKLLKRKMSKMGSYSGRPLLKLKKAEMIGLGLSAYLWVLNRKQAKYKELLSLLKCKISSYGRMGGDSYIMKYAVDDSHSSVFKGIQF